MSADNDELRLALAIAIQIMAEDAADSDGFTNRQIELIEAYAPLVGIELLTGVDEYAEPYYRLVPKPMHVVSQIKRERDFREAQRERRSARRAIAVVIFVALLVLALMLLALYFALLTNGGS